MVKEKTKIQKNKGAWCKYSLHQLVVMCALSVCIVFLSASAIFAVNENIPQIVQDDLINSKKNTTSDKTSVLDSENNSAEELSSNSENAETEILNAINDSKYDNVTSVNDYYGCADRGEDRFKVNWTNPKTETKDKTSTIRYAYISADGKQLIPLPAFQLEDIEQDYCNTWTRKNLDDGDTRIYFPIFWEVTNSLFDIRYYEETFNFNGRDFAFSDCLVSNVNEDPLVELKNGLQVSKFAYCYTDYNCSQFEWWGKNDLSTETSSWEHLTDLNPNGNTTVYVIFKDVTDYTMNSYDFKCSWVDSDTSYNAYVQYLYADGEPTTANLSKMTPPFAADIATNYTTSSRDANPFTMCNYGGRYIYENVKVSEGQFEKLPCVYNCAYVSLGPDPASTPYGYVYEENTSGWRKVYAATCYNSYWYFKLDANSAWTRMSAIDDGSYYQGDGAVYQEITYWTGKDHTGTPINVKNVKMHCNISLIYDYSSNSVVQTEDTSDQININLFDYRTWVGYETSDKTNYKSAFYNRGFNRSNNGIYSFNFGHGRSSDLPNSNYNINLWVADIQGRSDELDDFVNTTIWTNVLGDKDGDPDHKTSFPMLNRRDKGSFSSENREDLSYMFDPLLKSDYRKDYTNLNHLFYKENGYYVFNAAEHFAQIRKAKDKPSSDTSSFGSQEKDFVLYKKPTTSMTPWNAIPFFMPFDDKDNADALNYDWHFGLSIETNFLQPENGQVQINDTNSDMTFEFNGDDDVFVYIDDVLVLDLGGIHGAFAKPATINFATGAVQQPGTNHGETIQTNLKNLYDNAILDGKPLSDNFDWREKTFADFSQHTLKMYYMERGQAAGNCSLKFNLQTVPKSPIIVEKHIDKTDIGDKITYEGNFYYRAEVLKSNAEGSTWEPYGLSPIGTDSEGHDIYPTYDVYEYNEAGEGVLVRSNQSVERDDTAIDYGLFYLEDNQYAVLNGYNVNDQFKVAEYDPLKTIHGQGGIDDFNILWNVGVLEPGSAEYTPAVVTLIDGTQWYGTNKLKIGYAESNKVVFKNTPKADSFIDLRIKKMGDTTDDSDIYIGLNGTGPASFDPDTERDDSTPLLKNYEVFNSEGESQGIKTPVNGIITLKKDEYAVIEDVQMRSPVTAIAQHSTNITIDQKYRILEWDGSTDWTPGLMVNPYPAAQTAYENEATEEIPHTLYYSAEIPAINFPADIQDENKYSQINFWVKSDEPVPTALTIFKNPELWTFLFAAILILLVAGPISIIHKYRLSRRSVNLPTLNLHTTFFNI